RADLDERSLRFLARAGALRSLSRDRYQAHWAVAAIREPLALESACGGGLQPRAPEEGTAAADGSHSEADDALLPAPSVVDDMLDDYRYLGLTLGEHPLGLLRRHERLGGHLARCHSAAELTRCRHGQFVRVAGLVTGRQRPGTASG